MDGNVAAVDLADYARNASINPGWITMSTMWLTTDHLAASYLIEASFSVNTLHKMAGIHHGLLCEAYHPSSLSLPY